MTRKKDRAQRSEPAPPSPAGRWRWHLAASALVLVLLAWHRQATVVSEPGGRFEDPDAAFHARRAARAVAERTVLPPVFDAFENFPEGGRAVWPPLHDATLALLARLGGSTPADPAKGLGFAGVFPVLELVLVLLAAAALARRAGDGRGAAAAAWLVATTPVLLRRGAYGEIDHNVSEILGMLALALLAGRLRSLRGRARLAVPFAWAAGLLVALGFYAGIVLHAGLVAGGLLLAELAPGDGAEPEEPASPALAAGFALAAAALPLFASLRVRPDPADPWRLGPVYAFLLAAAAAGIGLLSLVPARRARSKAGTLLALGALAAGGLLLAAQPAGTLRGVAKGLGFVGSREVWLSTIEEFRPLLATPTAALGLLPAVGLLLAALVLGGRALLARRERLRAVLPVLAPALALLVLSVAQKRFLPPACAFAAAAAGALWPEAAPGTARRAALLGAAALGIALASPSPLLLLRLTLKGAAEPAVSPAEMAARALRELTPDPGSPPAWGVLAPWDYGHPILRLSGRPVALNNYGNFHPGFERKLSIFLETSPAKAAAALERERLRYVVAVYPPNVVPEAAAILGRDVRTLFPGGYEIDRPTPYAVTPAAERTLLVRLNLRGGAPFPEDGAADRAALARFRKVWEWEEGPGPGGAPVPFMQIWELLPPSPS